MKQNKKISSNITLIKLVLSHLIFNVEELLMTYNIKKLNVKFYVSGSTHFLTKIDSDTKKAHQARTDVVIAVITLHLLSDFI